MHFRFIFTSALAAVASAQSLTEVLTANNASLSALIGLIGTQPALASALGSAQNITILAPNNAALAAFLNTTAGQTAATIPSAVAALLQYHVINGTFNSTSIPESATFVPTLLLNTSYTNVTGGQRLEVIRSGSNVTIFSGLKANASVVAADITFAGGVIHVIDHVLTVPLSVSRTAIDAGLTSLAGALTSANLVSAVDGLSNVTIFAPSNAAFAAISSALGNLSTDALAGILQYHVVPNVLGYSSALQNDLTLTSLSGQNLTIRIQDGAVFVNSAKVVTPDVLVANGVVHVIDNVLNPGNPTVTPQASASTQSVAFSGASSGTATNVPFTSAVTATTTAPISTRTTASSIAGAAMKTGAIGVGALMGGAAVLMAGF